MVTVADVTAVIPTRGDRDLRPVLDSLIFDRVIVWNNAGRDFDAGTFGRWLAAADADTDVIYSQDDDVIVPAAAQQQLVDAYAADPGRVVVNMSSGHNHDFPGLHLFGWGSVFDRALPLAALDTWEAAGGDVSSDGFRLTGCDIVAGVIAPCARLDLGRRDLDYAHAADRVHNTPGYRQVKQRFYEEALALARGTRSAAGGSAQRSGDPEPAIGSTGGPRA